MRRSPCLWQTARNRAAIQPFAESMKGSCRRNDGGLLLMRCLILAAVCVVAGGPACAQPVDLGDEGLKQTVTGKTVHLDTPFGVAIPITYHGNGLMSGKAGVLEYFLGAQADRGRWWVANGKLCQKWFKWLDAEPSCMQLKQDGNKILWRRDDGLSGTATIASALPPGTEQGTQRPRRPRTIPKARPIARGYRATRDHGNGKRRRISRGGASGTEADTATTSPCDCAICAAFAASGMVPSRGPPPLMSRCRRHGNIRPT